MKIDMKEINIDKVGFNPATNNPPKFYIEENTKPAEDILKLKICQ